MALRPEPVVCDPSEDATTLRGGVWVIKGQYIFLVNWRFYLSFLTETERHEDKAAILVTMILHSQEMGVVISLEAFGPPDITMPITHGCVIVTYNVVLTGYILYTCLYVRFRQ